MACLDGFQMAAQTQINRGRNTKRVDTHHPPNPLSAEHATAGVRDDHALGQLHREETRPLPGGRDAIAGERGWQLTLCASQVARLKPWRF